MECPVNLSSNDSPPCIGGKNKASINAIKLKYFQERESNTSQLRIVFRLSFIPSLCVTLANQTASVIVYMATSQINRRIGCRANIRENVCLS